MDDLITSETFFTVVVALAGAALAWFKRTEVYAALQERKEARAWEALEAGVLKTWEVYVKAIRQSRADGKLTEEEKRQARAQAKRYAISYGTSVGVDVVKELGEHYMDAAIKRIVDEMKERSNYVPPGLEVHP